MLYGYAGLILRLDLGRGQVEKQPLPPELARDYIGGRGFVARLLYDELPRGIDPFDPANLFIMATGPLSGHFLPASGKTSFGCKSPASGGYADSNMGGHLGPMLKYAGYDALVLTGRAPEPSILVIDDAKVELVPAGDLWGMGSLSAEAALKKRLGEEFEIATIGPAGEKLVRFACISHDFGRQAGRTGIGAVLGSKNIKAICIRGTGGLNVPDPGAMLNAGQEAYAKVRQKPGFLGWTPEGTAGITDWLNLVGAFPTKNFSTSTWDQHPGINGAAILKELKITDKGCYGCPTPCGKYGKAKTGLGEVFVEGPEYETIGLLGGNCLLSDIHEVAYANWLCDELGLDTISAGVTVSWALECLERGILGESDLEGPAAFGDLASICRIIEMIALRRGLGDLLAEGTKRASTKVGQGSERFAIQVKGLEWSGYECRNAPGMMLAYMTADIGAHHNRAWVVGHDLAGSATNVHDLISGGTQVDHLPKSGTQGKAAIVAASQNLRPLFDLLGICRLQYMELGFEVENYEELFALITGRRLTWPQLLEISAKVWQLTRCISAREIEGFGRSWDQPPARFMEEPVPNGPNQGHLVSRQEVETLLDDYYQLRGWDQQGIPRPETLRACGLSDVAADLEAGWPRR